MAPNEPPIMSPRVCEDTGRRGYSPLSPSSPLGQAHCDDGREGSECEQEPVPELDVGE